MKNTIKSLLLAEDKEEEYKLFVKAVNVISPNTQVMRLGHGYDILTMLQTGIAPDAIFLDIVMPFKNGLLVLKEIRAMEKYSTTPIIMLTSSAYPLSIKMAYELNATFFANKPDNLESLEKTLRWIFESPYFQSCTQPPEKDFYVSM